MSEEVNQEKHQAVSSLMVLMFTDIVGSVAIKTRLGGAAYRQMVARHDQVYRGIVDSIRGAQCLKDTGDGFLSRFATASDAVNAALRFQQAMASGDWHPEPLQVRIGIHIGEVEEIEPDIQGIPKIVGLAVDITARIMGLAAGRQILLTRTAYESSRQYIREYPPGEGAAREIQWRRHGTYRFAGSEEAIEIFEVGAVGTGLLVPPSDGEKAWRAAGDGAGQNQGGDSAGRPNALGHAGMIVAGLVVVVAMAIWMSRKPEPTEVAPVSLSGQVKEQPVAVSKPEVKPSAVPVAPLPTLPVEATPVSAASPAITGVELLAASHSTPGFKLNLRTRDTKTAYREGETISFELSADRNCYVTLVSVDAQGSLTLLIPNAWQQTTLLRRGEQMVVPSPESGFKFPVQPPHGKTIVKAIATPDPLLLDGIDAARLKQERFVAWQAKALGVVGDGTRLSDLKTSSLQNRFAPDAWVTTELIIVTTP